MLPKAFSRLKKLSLTSQGMSDLIMLDETRFLKRYCLNPLPGKKKFFAPTSRQSGLRDLAGDD